MHVCITKTVTNTGIMCVFIIRKEGIEVRVVRRGEYDEEVVRWADAIISAGGMHTWHIFCVHS